MMHADPMYVALQVVHNDLPSEAQQARVRQVIAGNRSAGARGLGWLQRLSARWRRRTIATRQVAGSADIRTI